MPLGMSDWKHRVDSRTFFYEFSKIVWFLILWGITPPPLLLAKRDDELEKAVRRVAL